MDASELSLQQNQRETEETNISHVENYLASRRQHDQEHPLSSPEEKKLDTAALKSQINALIASAGIAMNRAQDAMNKTTSAATRAQLSAKLSEYQSVHTNAEGILQQLDSPGGGHNLPSIGAEIAELQSDSNAEGDKPDDARADTAPAVIAAAAAAEAAATSEALTFHMHVHAEVMQTMAAQSTVFADQAGIAVQEGQKDFQTVVDAAAALYDQQNGVADAKAKFDAILDVRVGQIEQQALKAGSSAEEATQLANASRERYAEKAAFLNDGVRMGDEEGAKRLSQLFNEFVQQPLAGHIEDSDEHFQKARMEMAQGGKQHRKIVAGLDRNKAQWSGLREKVEALGDSSAGNANVSHASGEQLYADLMSNAGVDERMKQSMKIADDAEELHNVHSLVYQQAGNQWNKMEAQVKHHKAGDLKGLAKKLDMPEKELHVQAALARLERDEPIGPALTKALFLDRMNVSPGQGMTLGLA